MAAQASVVALVVLAAGVANADDKRYTLADLEALVASNSYQEALQHAGDVAPAQRTARWLDITATASAGVLASLPTDDGSILFAIDAIDREYPQLLKVAKYSKVRGELGLKGLTGCWRNSDDCGKLATRLADGDPKLTVDVARSAVGNDMTVAVALFKRSLDPKLCKDEHLRRAIIAGLDRPRDSATAGEARSMMTTCWDSVKDAVVKAFDDAGKGSYVHKNTCDILAGKRLLSSLQTKRCK